MKQVIFAALIMLGGFFQFAIASEGHSPVGTWTTVDDETGEKKSVVKIWIDGKELKGQIIELLNPDSKGKRCTECKGAKKDQPIEGMVFVWGLTEDGEEWNGGKILDPNNGKEYKAKLKVISGGDQLEVRGFIGFALLGRTQIWTRVE